MVIIKSHCKDLTGLCDLFLLKKPVYFLKVVPAWGSRGQHRLRNLHLLFLLFFFCVFHCSDSGPCVFKPHCSLINV